ncbi:hypothetical protein [Nocardia asteroides]|uniref:hypothetical protein n=1 Tax=Nocardia asteroides TaxID=1824 RepID=UPI003417FC64
MRIIRGNDDHNDDEHNYDHGGQQRPATEPEAARMAETLIDEAEAFLAAAADAVPYEPEPEPKPMVRLVKSFTNDAVRPVPVEDEHLVPALRPQPELVPTARRVPRWARTALPGSLVVVGLAVVTTHGQPAVVAVPIDLYAGAWVGFLVWNAAHRPPVRDIAAGVLSGAIALATTVLAVLLAGVRAVVGAITYRRTTFETTRTAH